MPENKTVVVIKSDKKNASLNRIDELIKQIKFGSITIHVEDGHIIQIDKNEKIRLK